MNGTVKNITARKAFGFIMGEDGKEYFFHKDDFNGFWDDLESDHNNKIKIKVQFEPSKGLKGPRAANVSRLDWPNQSPG